MTTDLKKIHNRLEKIKVIYTDVDGTFVTDGCLFRNTTGYTLRNAQAIFTLLQHGVDVVMTSGREREKLKDTARILGFQNYIANLGIEIVYNQGEKVVTNFGIAVSNHQELKDYIRNTGVIQAIFKRFPGKIKYYTPWSDSLRTHHLLIGELNYPEVSEWLSAEFEELRIIDNGAVPPGHGFSSPHAYHILPRNVGKRAAVALDKRERNLRTENLIGIGDSMEDVTIAGEVGIFFLLDDEVPAREDNVIRIENRDGEGFSRIVDLIKTAKLL
ncbi:MAG: hypothetical protein Kow0042_05720 [Calditrichia bacterium]